ncbi:cold-shock protein [Paenibacillus sp. GP183]|jgi:hypothetical protein|uniref:cold-shock protein n=1 Tax=Paenibacillus sp. GP183 TaxID=1882751 RepID=UPI00089B67EA|nr:cold-shock protein [Paenibacillus sp. GP183]SEC47884.1 Cold-inducible protein YdjO [Paenibacillus sp. GP183]
MYFSKKNMEAVPEEQTSVWMCSTENCTCWMRENFSFEESPICPICKSVMVREMKMLPNLTNTNKKEHK